MQYLIWSNEHGAWWRPACMGYATIIAEAGRYGETEALAICEQAKHYRLPSEEPPEVMVPAPEATGLPSDIQQTHYEGCHRDKGHHACALAKIERLEAALRAVIRRADAGAAYYKAMTGGYPVEREEICIARKALAGEEGR